MKLKHYKISFIAVGLIATMIFASAALGRIVTVPEAPQFSEIYLLGQGDKASNIPFNITESQEYSVFLGIGNHMATSQYYVVDFILRNQTQSFPDQTAGTPSNLPTIYQYPVFVEKGQRWQAPITFSVSSFSSAISGSSLRSITFGNSTVNVNIDAQWDAKNMGFYYQILFELWTLNPNTAAAQYQNRYVYLWMNVTATT